MIVLVPLPFGTTQPPTAEPGIMMVWLVPDVPVTSPVPCAVGTPVGAVGEAGVVLVCANAAVAGIARTSVATNWKRNMSACSPGLGVRFARYGTHGGAGKGRQWSIAVRLDRRGRQCFGTRSFRLESVSWS